MSSYVTKDTRHPDALLKELCNGNEELFQKLMHMKYALPLSGIEQYNYVMLLRTKKNYSNKQIAEAYSRSVYWVSDILRIGKLTPQDVARATKERWTINKCLTVAASYSKKAKKS
jgi:hypothetical protein